MKLKILCLDDEIHNLETLERIFRPDFEVLTAQNAKDALLLLKEHSVAVIISDQRMPEKTGVEFLKESIALQPDAIRILLTGFIDLESIVGAINKGEIYRYLSKPWNNDELRAIVHQSAEKYQLRKSLQEKNVALEKALQELKTLDQSKTDFMLLINHELKTPLTGISSFLQLLQESETRAEQKLYLDRIEKNTERLKKMSDDVLEFLSAKNGQRKVQNSNFRIKNEIDSALSKLRDQARLKNLNFAIDSVDQSIQADREVMASVTHRLLENAIRYSHDGSTIEISVKDRAESLNVCIRNQGDELKPEALDNIRSAFVLNEDVMNHSKGLGLGLPICDALLKLQDSELRIQSQNGLTSVGFDLVRNPN